nr:GDSL-type esterase/lipase family protein [Acetobacter oeni]
MASGNFCWLVNSSSKAEALFTTAGTSVEIEAIVEVSTAGKDNMIVAMQDGLVSLAIEPSGYVQAYVGAVAKGTSFTLTSATTILDGTPHRIAATFDGSNVLIFIDGKLDASGAVTSTALAGVNWTTGQFGIGYFPGASGTTFANWGLIDEVAIFSPARDTTAYTPETVPYTGTETGLVALYHLDGNGTDSTVAAVASTTYTLTGSASLVEGTAATYTLTPNNSGPATAVVVTPASTITGTFSPATITLPAGVTTGVTFTFTPSATGAGTISTTNNGSLTDPAALTISVASSSTPFSTYTLIGPVSLTVGSASTFTVTPGAGAANSSAITITPASTVTGTFTPASVTFTAGSTSAATFTFTPGASGTGDLTTTNSASLTNPSAIAFSAVTAASSFTTYTLTGPAALTAGSASTYTITPGSGSALSSAVTFTPACTLGGTFSPATVTLSADSTTAVTFTFTPEAAGSGTLSTANSGSLTNPASLSLVATAAAVQTGPMNNAAITYSPWNWSVTAAGAISANPGAYLNFGFTGTTLQINCNISANSGSMPEFYVVIDGQAPQLFTAAATITVTLPTATSSWPVHTCELIFKSSTCTADRWSPQETSLTITNIVLTTGATLSVIAPFAKKVLVYGDSIVEGYQTLQKLTSTTTDAEVSDASLAWGYQLRNALGIEVGIVAFTGTGLTVTGNGNVPPLTTTWNQLWNGQPRDFTVAPDVIVINEGTNDGAHSASENAVQTAAVTVLQDLIATCPDTQIVVMQPFQGTGSYFTTASRVTVTTALQAAISQCASGLISWVPTDGWFTSAMPTADGTHPLGVSTIQDILPAAVTSLAPLMQQTLRVYSFF